MIRPLSPEADLAAVQALYLRAADYVTLESGSPPGPDAAARFFADTPPGIAVETGLKLGWDAGGLLGVADVAFGYPEATDGYIGLLMLDPAARGQGIGTRMVAEIARQAAGRGARRLLVAVLAANPRGLAFWQREGFAEERRFAPDARSAHLRIRMTRGIV